MSGSSLALLEMLLILAAVGGWAGWQLWSLRQEARRRAEREADETGSRRDADGVAAESPLGRCRQNR